MTSTSFRSGGSADGGAQMWWLETVILPGTFDTTDFWHDLQYCEAVSPLVMYAKVLR